MNDTLLPQLDLCPLAPVNEQDRFIAAWLAMHRMVEELSHVQKRLGTPSELDGDCCRAHELGHDIRNKIHVLQLWEDVRNAELMPDSTTA